MSHPWPLRVTRTGDGRAVAVHAGPVLLSAFRAGDMEMRDLTICALTEGSRFQGKTVAAAFGIQPSQVSRIRSRYREHGARGLVHQMGRPPLLSPARLRQARTWAGQGRTHAFTDRIGARGRLGAGTGASAAGAGAPADDLGILVCTQMSFTLGALTLEQARHLTAADAGALAGLTSLPSLRTWRQRLGELADRCDPLALQRRLASQMLAIEPAESQVYLADDHLAEYTGHQAVAMGRNPRRGKPTKGHDDTYICDLAGRAISFTTGEPSALCTTLPGALAGLTDALPARDKPGEQNRPLIVFDRGAAFPGTFTEVDAAGYDWLAWRRAPLAATTLLPVTRAITLRGGRQRQIAWTDEQITLKDYPKPVRQLTLFEHGQMAAQALTGPLHACPAEPLGWLRGRWAEENMFNYHMTSYGLDTLADYTTTKGRTPSSKTPP